MESENLNGKNGIDGFTSEFEQFFDAMSEKVREVNVEQIVTLYAIYLKNGRAEKMNGNGNGGGYRKPKSDPNAPATEKQVELLSSLMKKGKLKQASLEGLTKRDASKLLDEAFGKGGGR